MVCPYKNPTFECLTCTETDCTKKDAVSEWRKNNPEKVKAIRKRQYEKNKESAKECSKQYYHTHKNDTEFQRKQKENQRKQREKRKLLREMAVG